MNSAQIVSICLMLFLLGGCAGTSLFQPYPVQAEYYKQAFISHGGQSDAAELNDNSWVLNGKNALLHRLERGRVYQLNGYFKTSIQEFKKAIEEFEQADLEATLRLSSLAEQGSALLLNDNSIAYRGAPYERIFVHHHQAINYLALGDTEAAAVEFRKVALEQSILLEQYETELAAAESRMAVERFEVASISDQLGVVNRELSALKNSFQNAYTYYLSAVFWEAQKDFNRARIDYIKAAELKPELTFIRADIKRVELHMNLSGVESSEKEQKQDRASVIVFVEQGYVPSKKPIRIAFPMGGGELFNIALPTYHQQDWVQHTPMTIRDSKAGLSVESEEILNVADLVLKDYQEQIPILILRQALRAVAKHRLNEVSRDQLGLAGQFTMNVFSLLTEQADLRSWLSLPHAVQAARLDMSPGDQRLTLSTESHQQDVKLEIKPGQTIVIRVFEANNHLNVQHFVL